MRTTFSFPVLALGLCVATAGMAGLSSCSGAEEECLTTRRFFAQKVWAPIISKKCINCHTPYGLAKGSAFILEDESNPDFISHNIEVVAKIAQLEKGGASILLRKASGELSHGGGAQVSKDDSEYNALAELVARFVEPETCTGSAAGSVLAEATLLGWVPTLRKASMNLVSRYPTDAEEAKVKEGGEPAFDEVLLAMMKEDAFYERLKEIWNDYLLTDMYVPMPGYGGKRGYGILPGGPDDSSDPVFDDFPNIPKIDSRFPDERDRMYAGIGVAREPLELIAHVVRNGRPFTEIVTADYTLVNPFSAFVYGVDVQVGFADPKDPTEYREAKLHIERDGQKIPIEHAGVLTSFAWLTRFPSTVTSRNRSRANAALNLTLGINARRLAERTIDPTRVTGHNPTLNHPDCMVCHTVLDPVAGSFKQFPWVHPGGYVRYMPAAGGNSPSSSGNWPPSGAWFSDMGAPGLGGEAVPSEAWDTSEQWLGARIAEDSRFALSVVQKMHASLIGRKAAGLPGDPNDSASFTAWETQSAFMNRVADEFVSGGYDLRAVLLGIVKSPYYRAVGVPGERTAARDAELSGAGTGRILTPEMLDRKIEAVTGLAWSPAYKAGAIHNRVLLSAVIDLGKEQVRWPTLTYGGHEGGALPERFTSVNAVMANMGLRMANEMGCYATTWDFMHAPGERRLFPEVSLSDTPEDAAGSPVPASVEAIKKNIAHLYRRVWGVDVAPDGQEVDEAYGLFYGVWKDGVKAVADKVEPTDVPCPIEYQPGQAPDVPVEAGTTPLTQDADYTVRAWMAVLTYLLSDYTFLYE